MTLPVFLDRRASRELRDRLGYFSLIDAELARALNNDLSSTLQRISDHPYIYPHFAGGYRRAVLQRWSL